MGFSETKKLRELSQKLNEMNSKAINTDCVNQADAATESQLKMLHSGTIDMGGPQRAWFQLFQVDIVADGGYPISDSKIAAFDDAMSIVGKSF